MAFYYDGVSGTVRVVRTWQITSADQKLTHDLPAGEDKCLLEQFCPFFEWARMMGVQPAFEGAILEAQSPDPFGILDRGVDLQAVADDTRVAQQASAVPCTIICNFINIKTVISPAEILDFPQNCYPGESC